MQPISETYNHIPLVIDGFIVMIFFNNGLSDVTIIHIILVQVKHHKSVTSNIFVERSATSIS